MPLAELLPISVRISCTLLPSQNAIGVYELARSVENYCEMIKLDFLRTSQSRISVTQPSSVLREPDKIRVKAGLKWNSVCQTSHFDHWFWLSVKTLIFRVIGPIAR